MTEHGRDRVIYDMYAHPLDDDWQRRRSPFWELEKIDIPVLSIGAWGKAALHLRGNFMGYERVSGPKQLLVTGAASFAETQRLFADADFHREELLPWYHRRSARGRQRSYGPAIRRECLDHVVVFGERHLRHMLLSYMAYYNKARTHLSLNKDAPLSRPVHVVGSIHANPILGGLHHHYVRI